MRIVFVVLSTLIVLFSAVGQNLVPNGSFEDYTVVPDTFSQIHRAIGWNQVNNGPPEDYDYGTPDYYSGNWGAISAADGYGYAGFYTITLVDGNPSYTFREYISTQLTSPLDPNESYQVSFSLARYTYIDNNITSSNNVGLCFSTAPLTQTFREPIITNAQIEIQSVISHYSWVEYTYTFQPTDSFQYITIGNFNDDANTILTPSSNAVTGAYYAIDDIQVISLGPALSVTGDSVICPGDTTTLMARNDTAYRWALAQDPGNIISMDSSYSASPDSTTTYYVYGSQDTTTFTLTVLDRPSISLGNDTTICDDDTLLLDASGYAGNVLWQNGDTTRFYEVTSAGSYQVTVADSNGCRSSDSLMVAVINCDTTVSAPLTENDVYQVQLYPNPATSSVFLQTNFESNGCMNFRLYNLTGEEVYTDCLHFPKNGAVKIQLNLAPGLYIAELESADTVWRQKILISREQ